MALAMQASLLWKQTCQVGTSHKVTCLSLCHTRGFMTWSMRSPWQSSRGVICLHRQLVRTINDLHRRTSEGRIHPQQVVDGQQLLQPMLAGRRTRRLTPQQKKQTCIRQASMLKIRTLMINWSKRSAHSNLNLPNSLKS